MSKMQHASLPISQRGAALVVGLLLLLVLTVLAVSGMNSASTELAMAGNYQYRIDAFNAAEVGIENVLRNAIFNPNAAVVPPPLVGSAGGSPDSYTSALASRGSAPGPLFYSNTGFVTFFFDVRSQGSSVRNDNAINSQGTAWIANSGGGGNFGCANGAPPPCSFTP